MSKKKAFSGSTMTLKDFHGGSIPSDLSLPSAPGVVVRPSDRSGFDRPSVWGNPNGGRSDHRLRPGSSGTNRNFDEKIPFLSTPAHIGRNFDEDERKPLDGISHPRKTISDEVLRAPMSRVDQKPDIVTTTKYSGRPIYSPNSQSNTSAITDSFASRYTEPVHVGAHNQIPVGNSNNQVVPNAWGVRKEVGVSESLNSSGWSGNNAVSKFAQASALDKVSSGRWQTKLTSFLHQSDVEVIKFSGPESDYHLSGVNQMTERYEPDEIRGRHGQKGLAIDDKIGGGRKELHTYERAKSPIYSEVKDSNFSPAVDVVRPASTDGKYGGSKLQLPVAQEVLERPKLKLLPRSKPLEVSEPTFVDFKMVHQKVHDYGHVVAPNDPYVNEYSSKSVSAAVGEVNNQAVERPKLNLKPRTQLVEQSDGSTAKERKSVFGSARPRELVLKERGVDDVVINNLEPIQSPNRVKPDLHKTEAKREPVTQTARYGERLENIPADQRTRREPERKDIRGDNNKTDPQRTSWRNESWKNNRVGERVQQQQQEPRPEPETWRKPIEQPRPTSADSTGLRYGKAASALELAQAFSRSVSDAKVADRGLGQKGGISGQTQIPFSRLTATTTREHYSPGRTPKRHINGY